MTEKEKLVDRDLHLFEAINEGKGEHLEGSESLPPIEPLTKAWDCLLYTSPSPRDATLSRMPSSA